MEGTSPPTIAGVRILECFATSQSRPRDSIFIRLYRVPVCDGRSDGQTDGWIDGIAVGITGIASNAAAL